MPPRVDLWTDGSAWEGPGGWAYVLISGDRTKEDSGAADFTTNNRMELMAVIEGLAALKTRCRVTVHTDSQYVANPFRLDWISKWKAKNYRKIKNPDLWRVLDALVAEHEVTFEWTRGHVGTALNERCDYLAGEARRTRRSKSAALV